MKKSSCMNERFLFTTSTLSLGTRTIRPCSIDNLNPSLSIPSCCRSQLQRVRLSRCSADGRHRVDDVESVGVLCTSCFRLVLLRLDLVDRDRHSVEAAILRLQYQEQVCCENQAKLSTGFGLGYHFVTKHSSTSLGTVGIDEWLGKSRGGPLHPTTGFRKAWRERWHLGYRESLHSSLPEYSPPFPWPLSPSQSQHVLPKYTAKSAQAVADTSSTSA